MKQSLFLTAGVLVLVSGCSTGSSKFGCPGMPAGVTCMSARDVYQATNNADRVLPKDPNQPVNSNMPAEMLRRVDAPVFPVPVLDKPIPVRTQAKVLRIWIAPWQTSNGDLNVPGYVYTEIEPRRWNMGENLVVKQRGSVPYATQLKSVLNNGSRKNGNDLVRGTQLKSVVRDVKGTSQVVN